MTDVSCFHHLKTGGIERQLAPGVSARVFPGVHAMLSVVTLEPGAVSPVRGLTGSTGRPPRRHRRLRAVRPSASVVDDSLRAWPVPSRAGDTIRAWRTSMW